MWDDLYAIELIAVTLLTIVLLFRYGAKPTHWWKVLLGGGLAFLVFLQLALYFSQEYSDVAPTLLLLPLYACALIVFMPVSRWRFLAMFGVIAALFTLLTWQRIVLLEALQDAGSPWVQPRWCESNRSYEEMCKKIRGYDRIDTTVYPAGWLRESKVAEYIPEERRHLFTKQLSKDIPLWHTPLTSISNWRAVRLELWYPGGTLKEAVGALEYRPVRRQP